MHRGIYKKTGKEVAIKRVLEVEDLDTEKYYMREAEVMAKCNHPFVLGFTGLAKHESGLFLVTEYVNGGDLRQYVEDKMTDDHPWDNRVSIAIQMAQALDYLHDQCIVHRDVKTDNVLINEDGSRVWMCDFGLSRPMEHSKKKAHMTMCGTDMTMAVRAHERMSCRAVC